jgi:hypothetical protein
MRLFIVKFICFFSFVIVQLFIDYYLVLHQIENNPFVQEKENCINDDYNNCFNSKTSFVVSIGNSRALAAIDKDFMEKWLGKPFFQLAYLSSDITHSKLVLKSLISQKKTPGIVFLEVSWFSFNTNRTNICVQSLPSIIARTSYNNLNLSDFFYLTKEGFLRGVINQYFKILKGKNNLSSNKFSDKWTDKKSINPNSDLDSLSKLTFDKIYEDGFANIDKRLWSDFIEILNVCKENKLKIILYSPPESNGYIKLQKDRALILDSIYNTAKNNNIPWFNFNTYSAKSNGESILFDSHHVGDEKYFTRFFIDSIGSNLQSY